MYEPVGCIALKTACGLDCAEGREPFHTLSLTTEDHIVTCPSCRMCVGVPEKWVVEGKTHKKFRTEF